MYNGISLIIICFSSIVYAESAYIVEETQIMTVEGGGQMYLDKTSVMIPFTQVGEPNTETTNVTADVLGIPVILSTTTTTTTVEEATFGDVKITATSISTTETQPSLDTPIYTNSKTYTVTLPDGTVAQNAKITFTNADGKVSVVEIPTTGEVLDINSDIKTLLDYPVSADTKITMTYTDEAGNEQPYDMGEVGGNIEVRDFTVEPPESLASGVLDFLSDPIGTIASFIEEILVRLFLSTPAQGC